MVVLITKSEEMAYKEEVRQPEDRSKVNDLFSNISEMKWMVVNFRKSCTTYSMSAAKKLK